MISFAIFFCVHKTPAIIIHSLCWAFTSYSHRKPVIVLSSTQEARNNTFFFTSRSVTYKIPEPLNCILIRNWLVPQEKLTYHQNISRSLSGILEHFSDLDVWNYWFSEASFALIPSSRKQTLISSQITIHITILLQNEKNVFICGLL